MAESATVAARLRALAAAVAQACPDVHVRVHDLALDFLERHGLSGLDPNTLYWHRFDNAVSHPQAYSGWAHDGPPVESLTLAQLIMHRFNSNDQDAPDQLDMMSGFYTAGPSTDHFDQRNEVRLLPHQLLDWLWCIDLKRALLAEISGFWQSQQGAVRVLAKANFMAHALEERQVGVLTDADLAFLFKALTNGAQAPLGFDALEQEVSPPPQARVYFLQIGDYQASDLLCVEAPDGTHYVWVPGEAENLHKFTAVTSLHWWLLMQNKDAKGRSRFMTHFPLASQQPDEHGLNHTLDLLYFTWGTEQGTRLLYHPEQRVTVDPFTALAQRGRERMESDARLLLHSNAEQRKKMWLGYLGAVDRVFGPMAALDWPVALAVVGAGLADMGLQIDQAVNGATRAERRAGVIGAIVAGFDVLFNGLYLWGAWAGEAAPRLPETEHPAGERLPGTPTEPGAVPSTAQALSIEHLLPSPPDQVVGPELLDNLEANVLLEGYSPQTEGRGAGVYALPNGDTYVSIDGLPYRVRYAPELETWIVVNPDNPYAFGANVPLRRTPDGVWEALPRLRLEGGGRFDTLLGWARRSPRPQLGPRTPSAYDLPERFEARLNDILLDPADRTLQGYIQLGGDDGQLGGCFSRLQERLRDDARAFYRGAVTSPHPSVPSITPDQSLKEVLRQLFARSKGLVIGEAHYQVAAKQLLIEQMPRLAKAGVDTLYMEHLLTDVHQTDLDSLFTTGKLPARLERYLKALDEGHLTDPTGRYSFLNLVKAAGKSGVRVKALDCTASYKHLPTLDVTDTTRQKLMNYYAHQVISAEPPAGKWIALVGNSHSDRYLGVPGLADLEGAISLRAEDVPPGIGSGISADAGIALPQDGDLPIVLKSDLRWRASISGEQRSGPIGAPSLQRQLAQPGDYLLANTGLGPQIIHRSRTGELVYTRVRKEGGLFYVERPQWSAIDGQRFQSLALLSSAVELRVGLRPIDLG